MAGIIEQLSALGSLAAGGLAMGEPERAHATGATHALALTPPTSTLEFASTLVLLLPMLGVMLVTFCAVMKVRSKLPAVLSVGCLAGAFAAAVVMFLQTTHDGHSQTSIVHVFDWINFSWGAAPGQSLTANFSLFIDSLTCLWMLFVTGLAAVIALYASEYMGHDVGPGYCRFFAAFNLFVFSMSCLVMGDNLLLLFLGWEGVGLCSYLLIGYFYQKPAAVAAGKKAFIMNRIGDLGLVMGLMLAFVHFGSIEYRQIFPIVQGYLELIAAGHGDQVPEMVRWISLLLTVGAFGKSAQIFFYVWLPDAMEGPTPVSALIHAATMVTAGVFLIARMYPLYTADPAMVALTVVAWSGVITALWAATIEMAIFDIKRVMGYSTISQLGFMFAGLGVLTPVGAAFHTFTHAFFKATLFLGVGAVMHGFGGQLDLRRLSGVMWMRGFGLVGIAMLIGSINLSGVPFTAGFFSKDMILAQAFVTDGRAIAGSPVIAWLLLITAGMTAYYTFRTFMRVYVGPKAFVPGDDAELVDMGRHPKGVSLDEHHSHHGHGQGHGHGHGTDHSHSRRVDFDPTTEEFDPHPPGVAMKAAIAFCAIMTLLVAGLYFYRGAPGTEHGGWVGGLIHGSTASYHSPEHGGTFLGMDPHKVMYYVSAGVGLIGILIAAFLHGPRGIWGLFIGNRTEAATSRADKLVPLLGGLVTLARNKWYVDEFYHAVIVKPLWVLAHICHMIDKLLVDGLVNLFGWSPRGVGTVVRRTQSGLIHDYALRMVGGLAMVLLIIWFVRSGPGGSGVTEVLSAVGAGVNP